MPVQRTGEAVYSWQGIASCDEEEGALFVVVHHLI